MEGRPAEDPTDTLHDLKSLRHLTGEEKSFDQFTVAANSKPAEYLEPLPVGNFWLSVHPTGKLGDLIRGNSPLSHSSK